MTNTSVNSVYYRPTIAKARQLIGALEQVGHIESIENVVLKSKSTLVVTFASGFVSRIVYSTSVLERIPGATL